MISDLDIWRAANLLIRQHGDDAELAAARRADLMLERGDLEGQTAWKQIGRAIVELQAADGTDALIGERTQPPTRTYSFPRQAPCLDSMNDAGYRASRPRARPWTSTRAQPGSINVDVGECLPQPFLVPVPDPISFGLGMRPAARSSSHRRASIGQIAEPIEKPSKAAVFVHASESQGWVFCCYLRRPPLPMPGMPDLRHKLMNHTDAERNSPEINRRRQRSSISLRRALRFCGAQLGDGIQHKFSHADVHS